MPEKPSVNEVIAPIVPEPVPSSIEDDIVLQMKSDAVDTTSSKKKTTSKRGKKSNASEGQTVDV
jgi:hypothetical protein